MKEDDLYQKACGNIIFSVCMRRRIRRGITLLAKKQRCPQKMHLRVTSPASLKKIIFILDWSQIHPISAEITLHRRPRKGPRSSRRRCSTGKRVLRNFAKLTGKDLCQGLFFNKATDLRPAILLKKSFWRRYFPVNFCEISKNTFLPNTPWQLFLEFKLFSVLLWRPLQTFLYIAFQ